MPVTTNISRSEKLGHPNVSVGSEVSLRGKSISRLESGVQPKQIARKLTFALERLKLDVFSPWLMPCQNGKF
jgi:hypothetical protein